MGPGNHSPPTPIQPHPWCWNGLERTLKVSRCHLIQPPVSRQDTLTWHRSIHPFPFQHLPDLASRKFFCMSALNPSCCTYSKAHLMPLCPNYHPRRIRSIIRDMLAQSLLLSQTFQDSYVSSFFGPQLQLSSSRKPSPNTQLNPPLPCESPLSRDPASSFLLDPV